MIKPSVGRVVLYRPLEERDDIRHAAIVTMVHNDELINLSVFDCNGVNYHRQEVKLIQDPIVSPESGQAEWMAYQHGQAAKLEEVAVRNEELEQAMLDASTIGTGAAVVSAEEGITRIAPANMLEDGESFEDESPNLVEGDATDQEVTEVAEGPDDDVVSGDDLIDTPEDEQTDS